MKFFLFILFFIFPFFLLANAEGPDFYKVKGVVAGDVLNIRTLPSTQGKIVGGIPPETKGVRNEGDFSPLRGVNSDGSRWCKVSYKEVVGWVNCRFLAGDGETQ